MPACTSRFISACGSSVSGPTGSLNGSFVNGERVSERALNTGDEIALGNTVLRFVEEDGAGQVRNVTVFSDMVQSQVRSRVEASAHFLPATEIHSIDALHASVSVLRMIFGTTAVDFGLEIGDGALEGKFVRSTDASELALDISDLSVAGLAPLEEIVQLPLEGTLAGHVVQWRRRYDGLEVIVTNDPNLQGSSRWYWQLDAWQRSAALTGGARTKRAALRQCEVMLARLARALREAA